MGKSKTEIHSAVVEASLVEFDRAYSSQQEVRLKCLRDRRFVFVEGAMWEDSLRLQFDNKPRFEVNKLHMSCVRIFNEYRNNRISVEFRPVDDAATSQTADTLCGLYRADEQRSGGQEAYDNAFEEGVAGGMGAWRLRNVYTDEYDQDDDTQKIVFEPIYDADSSVFFSLDGKKYDKSDAHRCWVISAVSRDAYAENWGEPGEADPYGKAGIVLPSASSFKKVQKMTEFDWYTPDVIYVAEYYCVEEIRKRVHVFRLNNQQGKDTKVPEAQLTDEYRESLAAQGYTEIRVRTVKERRVHKWIHDGTRVLEDCGYVAGPNIPVIPFYGKRAYIDNMERIMGHVRLGTDAQRLFNMQISLLAIINALAPRRKPIFLPEQIKNHAATWASDNIDDNPFLLVDPIKGANGEKVPAGPIGYTEPPPVPESLAALMQVSSSVIQEVTGEQQAGEQIVSNVSAKAVELVQNKIDMQSFIYMDNMSKSMQRSGEVWLGMAREIYDEENRTMPFVGKDDARSNIKLKQPKMVDGAAQVVNDPATGKFDVLADTGPAFKSRRDATVRALVGMLQFIQDPKISSIVTSLILTNMDGEGLDDLREFLRMQLVTEGVVQPTEEEARKLAQQASQQQNQPPSPQDQWLMEAAGNEAAKAGKTKAETLKTLADAANSRADAVAKLANAKNDHLQTAIQILQTLIATTGPAAAAASAVPAQPVANAPDQGAQPAIAQ
ncbi:hypothetical protein PIN31009_05550 [Pandoraea iniqua]|uniref:portal protein n=1 Tax=Pandoraea iniqua TaxID=2508288 RepID=UPI0012421AED|nr:portal protein [Pandoraea iniqua]VVE59477.1 hypothetical protein PIN31009_05550 [Pandoraea iniqua]